MANESPPNDRLKAVWQNQPSEGLQMSVDEIRRRAGKFQKKINWRNAREYVAALVVIVIFGFDFWHTSDALARVAFGMIIAGTLYVMWQLHQRGASRSLPAEMGLASGLQFYRQELKRQRDLVRSVASWYLGPMVPGLVVLMVARARTNPGHLRPIGLSSALIALIFVSAWWLNQRAARRLQSRIDELNALEGQR
jgi:uncharacterized membrane protein